MHRVWDWAQIQRYHDEGHGFVECRQRFGFTHGAWNRAIKRGDLVTKETPFADRRRRYDWAAVQAYYDEGHSFRECQKRFGFSTQSWQKARLRGEIRSRPWQGMPLDELLQRGISRDNLKIRLIRAGLLPNSCQHCGLREWLGKPLSMQIDHINGVKDDNRLENLRMLCPNCHSQTETYGGRNAKRRRRLQDTGRPV